MMGIQPTSEFHFHGTVPQIRLLRTEIESFFLVFPSQSSVSRISPPQYWPNFLFPGLLSASSLPWITHQYQPVSHITLTPDFLNIPGSNSSPDSINLSGVRVKPKTCFARPLYSLFLSLGHWFRGSQSILSVWGGALKRTNNTDIRTVWHLYIRSGQVIDSYSTDC